MAKLHVTSSLSGLSSDEEEGLIIEVLEKFDLSIEMNRKSSDRVPHVFAGLDSEVNFSSYGLPDFAVASCSTGAFEGRSKVRTSRTFVRNVSMQEFADFVWLAATAAATATTLGSSLIEVLEPLLYCDPV